MSKLWLLGGVLCLAVAVAVAQEYRFRTFFQDPPRIGESAPDFTLKTLDGKEVKLSDLWKQKPVVIEFGAYT